MANSAKKGPEKENAPKKANPANFPERMNKAKRSSSILAEASRIFLRNESALHPPRQGTSKQGNERPMDDEDRNQNNSVHAAGEVSVIGKPPNFPFASASQPPFRRTAEQTDRLGDEEKQRRKKEAEERFWREYAERNRQRATQMQKMAEAVKEERSGVAAARKFFSSLPIKELKRILELRGVDWDGCIEREDLVTLIISTTKSPKPPEKPPSRSGRQMHSASFPVANNRLQKEREKQAALTALRQAVQERIARKIESWSAGKSMRDMINDLNARREKHGLSFSARLSPTASYEEIKKSYRKLLLHIHPDKVDQNDVEAHVEATEIFKTMNTVFALLKARHER
eukprot:CAMPEP_0196653688 /NCGR_PEP_ID=MMETSP1086-20130531/3338_1 /TAXON_ID=77921 /ORGANISM="Cyanoptyche  gloeocystis , Strain SAG4.97" /LENGTH=342 /DNA_ID=CAMNT_0041985011 /DNA_START=16 /DNA_END=1044 /DNA_ORIENTATION=+